MSASLTMFSAGNWGRSLQKRLIAGFSFFVEREDVDALGSLVYRLKANQTAAASAGAVELLVQLARSDDAALQLAAVETLRLLVDDHEANQRFAFALLFQLIRSEDAAVSQRAQR